ncbi:hypothetical protein DXG01_003348 [Tephrocybe rancida]|nr:hypothetical protein DXG01_003348 [Tephrocybe rancida]
MAPAHSSIRQPDQNNTQRPSVNGQNIDLNVNPELFLDPMLGTPLAMYVEKDVEDKDTLVDLIPKYGGTISPGYSGVPYILVNPHKASGQNLWRQYASKKGKIVLNSRWVHECIKANALQTFHTNWADCKVTGNEVVTSVPEPPPQPVASTSNVVETRSSTRKRTRPNDPVDPIPQQVQQQPPLPPPMPPQHTMHPPPQVITPMTVSSLVEAHNNYPYHVYDPGMHPPRPMQPAPAPPQTWQASGAIAPQQTRLDQPPMASLMPPPQYPDDSWERYGQPTHSADPMVAPPAVYYRYREDQTAWGPGPHGYYDPTAAYEQAYQQPQYIEEPPADTNAAAGPSTAPPDPPEKRGRKRTRTQPPPATPATALVVNKNPPARSPTPPSRVIKSTYGGNLFTSDDVFLREICERIAVKAPHHTLAQTLISIPTKHQIRLGGYVMTLDRPESPMMDEDQEIEEEGIMHSGPGAEITTPSQRTDPALPRNRSPTPPRALYRSTTGKGVAFTEEDVTFLRRFMEYRTSQGRLDMVAFWKDVALKAPHHSRASWMKFWRRHKHEFSADETTEPLPVAPEKKMRYSREDDILLARYFFEKPEGTSDKIFQNFGRLVSYPHHPWKGWQEHHRIHKAKIDHFMQMLTNGENLDVVTAPGS